jgi:hypothetical protein
MSRALAAFAAAIENSGFANETVKPSDLAGKVFGPGASGELLDFNHLAILTAADLISTSLDRCADQLNELLYRLDQVIGDEVDDESGIAVCDDCYSVRSEVIDACAARDFANKHPDIVE